MDNRYNPATMAVLADRVYMLRHSQRMSQQELAGKVGCSPVTISNLETKKLKSLTIEHLVALSKVFGVSTDHLLGLEDVREAA